LEFRVQENHASMALELECAGEMPHNLGMDPSGALSA